MGKKPKCSGSAFVASLMGTDEEYLDGAWADDKEAFREQLIADIQDKILNTTERRVESVWVDAKGKHIPLSSISKKGYGRNNSTLLCVQSKGDFESPFFVTPEYVKRNGGKIITKSNAYQIVGRWPIPMQAGEMATPETADYYKVISKRQVVYNLADVEGIKGPQCFLAELEDKKIDYCENIVNAMIAKGRLPKMIEHNVSKCFYSPGQDTIKYAKSKLFQTDQLFYSTLFHEIVHSTGHESRLNRNQSADFGTSEYAEEELVAEIGAVILCTEIGLAYTRDESIAYIQHWKEWTSNPDNTLLTAYGKAVDAVEWLLDGIDYDKLIPKEVVKEALTA